jgi:NADPH:quinone reductase-like Zn-dependent oxidoreductase
MQRTTLDPPTEPTPAVTADTMKAIVQDRYGSGEVLELREIDKPAIGDHDVLVRVRAAAVNPGDWAIMSGLPYIARPAPLYGLRRPKNPVRGVDVAGQVEAVGAGVTLPRTARADRARASESANEARNASGSTCDLGRRPRDPFRRYD